jgi:hypothetical protein
MAKKTKPVQTAKKTVPKEGQKQPFNYLALFFYFVAPLIFVSLPRNKTWLNDRLMTYYREIPVQQDSLRLDFRNAQRHGPAFTVFDFACKNIPKGSRFLMPPQTYFLKNLYDKQASAQLQDPLNFLGETSIFSFHCMDLIPITLQMDEQTVRSAQYTVLLSPQKTLQLVKIENDTIYKQIRQIFDLPLDIITDRQKAIDFINAQ